MVENKYLKKERLTPGTRTPEVQLSKVQFLGRPSKSKEALQNEKVEVTYRGSY
jgi:hypothetical protein